MQEQLREKRKARHFFSSSLNFCSRSVNGSYLYLCQNTQNVNTNTYFSLLDLYQTVFKCLSLSYACQAFSHCVDFKLILTLEVRLSLHSVHSSMSKWRSVSLRGPYSDIFINLIARFSASLQTVLSLCSWFARGKR